MSGTRKLELLMAREIESWPNVTYDFDIGGKHGYCTLSFNGVTRRVYHSISPSDGNAHKQFLRDVRATLKGMGAFCLSAPASKPKAATHRPKPNTAPRLPRGAPEPVAVSDWQAPLAMLRDRMTVTRETAPVRLKDFPPPALPEVEPQRQTMFSRFLAWLSPYRTPYDGWLRGEAWTWGAKK